MIWNDVSKTGWPQDSVLFNPYWANHVITHVNVEWEIKGAAVLFYTIPHLKKSVITPLSFCFNPIKLPLTLQFMQNTDKCKMSPISARREFKFHKITISVCCSLTAPWLIFHLQRFISSFSPRWPCKSQINFHFKCLASDCCRKTPSSVLGNTTDPNLTGSRSEKNTGCNFCKTTPGPSGRGHYWTEIISSSKQCVTLHEEMEIDWSTRTTERGLKKTPLHLKKGRICKTLFV